MASSDQIQTLQSLNSPDYNYEGTFYAVDGSNIKYIQDSQNGIFKVQMPDGSFYSMGSGTNSDRVASTYTDRNGNHIDYYSADNAHPNGYWTDTLGRTIDVPFTAAPTTPTVVPYEYHLPGLSDNITYKLHWKKLKDTTQETSALTEFSDSLKYLTNVYRDSGGGWHYRDPGTFLFPSEMANRIAPSEIFNPILLTEIELPNGQSYQFSYNVYGELDRIKYPTGGVEQFVYSTVAANAYLEVPYAAANRGVTDRKVYRYETDPSPYHWIYSSQTGSTSTVNPDGTRYERYMHKTADTGSFGFGEALTGMPYEERTYSSDNKLVLRKLTHWQVTTTGSYLMQWHPRVDYEEAIVYDSAGNGLSAITKHEYNGNLSLQDTPLLESKTTNYTFSVKTDGASFTPGQGPSSPTTIPTVAPTTSIRSSEVTYLIDDPNYSSVKSNYTSQNINGLVTIAKVKDGSGNIVSQSETVYDESGRSPGYRGNPTTAKAWDSTKGTATNPAAYIAASATFDQYGNKVSATDALGNTTTTTYDTTYHAFPESVTTPVPDPSGQHGSSTAFTTTATFDWATGLPLTTTDVNGLKTSIEYDPATLRPRYTRYYDGSTQIGPTNETIYHDETGNVWVKSRAQIDTNKFAETITYFDGLGRAWKTETTDSGGNIFTEKEFDSFGRVSRVCNPYRVGEAKVWTTNVYDTSSRVVEVDFPDASTITTAYGVSTSGIVGLTKTITDQAGKKRKGYTDASGNMVRVVEDPSGTALTTDYTFDTLGNLRKTAQGSQYRYFYHDSLGRLLYARQVEQLANPTFSGAAFTDPITGNNQWSVKYEYNDGGSIVSTTDANNAAVSAEYDRLNRITKRTYTGTTTPNVDFYYDGKYFDANDTAQTASGAVKGKTTGIKSTVSKTNFTAFDLFGRPTSHQQITDGTTYTTGYAYNLSGALIEETYPSGRVVKSTLDENGDLSQIQSKKNAASGYWTYADAISRDSAGNVTKMQLGNGLWETAGYNSRTQVTMIGLGTTDAAQNLLKLDYSYATTGVHDNNGSLREQKVTVPTVGTNAGFTATQSYTYDDLNRLVSAAESVSGAQTWKQTFQYDRFGNRRFDAANTTTLGSCSQVLCNPMISAATNRISESGYSYDANGSLTANAAGERFGYDAEGHQTEFFNANNSGSTPDGTYAYDGEGKRVKKETSSETTIFVYDAAGKVVAEYSTTLATVQQVSYLTQDHLGSPRVTTNENGEVTNRKDFAAFGEEVVSAQRVSGNKYASTPDEVRQDYTGYEKDEESGLEFAQARYYNPTHGRFTSVDPLTASATIRNPQTLNRYSYALNSPYKFTDPLGLAPEGYWQTKYSNYGQCTAQAEFCGDDWNMWIDRDLEMFAAAGGDDVEKELKHNKSLYRELKGTDLETVKKTLTLARDILAEPEILKQIINTFRKDGDTTTPLDALNSLDLDGGIVIVGEGENRGVKIVANVFDGRDSAIPVRDPFDNTVRPASVAFALHKRLGAFTILPGGRILLGKMAFSGSTIQEKVLNLIHETVVHKGFKRLDTDFGPTTITGSENINTKLIQILEKSKILEKLKND
ncbi:MAG TPA: RHS repeat-associated core domain-containing protein [Pyrinomonadaceae bacterium]|nr:RHS repeat-associated core domain-containing protein [Pyrinomonadaceae bacterium]